ncbi:MAG: L-threonylcarbamoyladenylate synthase [Parvibaculaceae bacterium]
MTEKIGAGSLARAAAAIRKGELVAFPTETVYGLGADALDEKAVARVFEAKGRPRFNPLIVHVSGIEEAMRLGRLNARARLLAERFWPGPLTLVVPRAAGSKVSLLASAGLDSLAIRMPAHPLAQALIEAAARPLVGPSANPSGRLSPTTADDVMQGLAGRIGLVLDGGSCPVGIESSIVSCLDDQPALLRPGGLPREAIEEAIRQPLARTEGSARPVAPGQLESHYAPNAALRLDAADVRSDEALLAFGSHVPAHVGSMRNLSPGGDLVEAAANLFRMLRELDGEDVPRIAVMPVPRHGLGEAINDRLVRAAAPRSHRH